MRPDPTPLLVSPIVKALGRVGVTQDDILSGPIQFSELDWMAPPLTSQVTLEGMPFMDYLDDYLPWVDPAALYGFWMEVLALAHTSPHKLYTAGEGWRGLSRIMPTAPRVGWRKLWLPLHAGLPYVDDHLGALISVEVAHLAKLSGHATDFVESHDDYYGTLPSGDVIGVRNGLPALPSAFDTPVHGMVPEFLEMPRGELRSLCEYDLLDKLRSMVWVHREKLPEFEGLDLACQTLRIITEGKGSAAILHGVKGLRAKLEKEKLDRVVLKRCLDLMSYRGVSDARKIEGLRSMLVPAVMNLTEFRRDFYKADKSPPFVSEQIISRIHNELRRRLMQAGEPDAD